MTLAGFIVVPIAILWAAAVGMALRRRPNRDLRVRWLAWGVLVAATTGATVAVLDTLLAWPPRPGLVALAATAIIPMALMASTADRTANSVDDLLVHTVIVAGLIGLVAGTYLVVVVGLGRLPVETERSLIGLSMGAAAVAAVLAGPARRRLEEFAVERVRGGVESPDEALRTFGGRMSRAVPMDELLLQLVETLRKTMHLTTAEIWTGSGGTLERTVSVPDRPVQSMRLTPEEETVAARAHVQGNAWAAVWVPLLLQEREDRILRVAAVAHLGDLLGLIVVERSADAAAFTDDDDRVLNELARQVGLALHNVRLDSALQASLDELRQRNEELAASRLRIVTAADESRRKIERDLHDGAQQHLVALAVKVGLVKQLMEGDPATATAFVEELRDDVQATLTELRSLAHGIYPPLLRDRGLVEALRTAANRSTLPTEVCSGSVGRYDPGVEAAVYFCCLEAMQNAAKHGGDGATVTVSLTEEPGRLRFDVSDTGPGFDVETAIGGSGFVNMADRLGAVDGTLEVSSSFEGTRIGGVIAIGDIAAESPGGDDHPVEPTVS